MIVVFIFLYISYWLLNRHRWVRFITRYTTEYARKASWFLVKGAFRLLGKILRKVTSLFDPY